MQSSKFQALLLSQKTGYLKQQITVPACECEICFNDVRPLVEGQKQRQKSSIEYNLCQTDAMYMFLQKTLGYRGVFLIPDIFYISQSQLYYTNDMGKLKCKQKQTNSDAKKHFEQKRKKNQKYYKIKQIAILIYKNGSHQLLTQSHFNKVILKRKNDSLWHQTKAIVLLPPTASQLLQYKQYSYKRNQDTIKNTQSILQKVIEDVDSYQQKNNKQQINKNSSSFMGLSMSMNMSMSLNRSKFGFLVDNQKIIQQAIVYIQIVHKIRILSANFQYIEDSQGQPYLMQIKNFIATSILPQQQKLALHDRYKQLDIIGQQNLIIQKMKMDNQDKQAFWNLCTQLTRNCIQTRKIELKLKDVKKLKNKQLKQMFMKIFPDFSPSQLFSKQNWKNEISQFIKRSKIKITKLFNTDQGISILKRYGIVFYRTF